MDKCIKKIKIYEVIFYKINTFPSILPVGTKHKTEYEKAFKKNSQ